MSEMEEAHQALPKLERDKMSDLMTEVGLAALYRVLLGHDRREMDNNIMAYARYKHGVMTHDNVIIFLDKAESSMV